MRNNTRLNVRKSCALSATLLSLLVVGCATTSPPYVSDCPTPSRPPSLRQPIPSQPYSTSAKATIEQWQKSLTGMPAMSRP